MQAGARTQDSRLTARGHRHLKRAPPLRTCGNGRPHVLLLPVLRRASAWHRQKHRRASIRRTCMHVRGGRRSAAFTPGPRDNPRNPRGPFQFLISAQRSPLLCRWPLRRRARRPRMCRAAPVHVQTSTQSHAVGRTDLNAPYWAVFSSERARKLENVKTTARNHCLGPPYLTYKDTLPQKAPCQGSSLPPHKIF